MENDVSKNLEDFINNVLPKAVTEAMKKACLIVERDSKQNCPVDDGLLRGSIKSEVETNKPDVIGYVGSNLDYAPYVHNGTGLYAKDGNGRKEVPWTYCDDEGKFHSTKGQKPNPFIQDAIDKDRSAVVKCFENII